MRDCVSGSLCESVYVCVHDRVCVYGIVCVSVCMCVPHIHTCMGYKVSSVHSRVDWTAQGFSNW